MDFRLFGCTFRQNKTLRFLWLSRQVYDFRAVTVGFVTDDFGNLTKVDLECLRVSLS